MGEIKFNFELKQIEPKSVMVYNHTSIAMKITFKRDRNLSEFKKIYPKSSVLNNHFDECFIGLNEESESFIYNLYGVIELMIKDEYPEVELDSDEWFDCYDEMNDRLSYGDGIYGLENLQEYLEGNIGNFNPDLPPYTFCLNPKVIDYKGVEEFIMVDFEVDEE